MRTVQPGRMTMDEIGQVGIVLREYARRVYLRDKRSLL